MIHVLIKRRIAEGLIANYEISSRQVLHNSYIAPGFISGEAFTDMSDPHQRYLLCKWRSVKDWTNWQHSDERQELMNLIQPILTEPETVTLLTN